MDFTHFIAGKDDDGRRLDKILRRFLQEDHLSVIYKSLRNGLIKVNGKKCAHVKVGECVRFTVDVEVPQDAGDVTEILFAQQEKELTVKDTESNGVARLMLGDDMWDGKLAFEKGTKDAVHTAHAETIGCYDKPGPYFATVRIATNRRGESDPFTQVLNLDRARIIVES